jgi:hypothetical protein
MWQWLIWKVGASSYTPLRGVWTGLNSGTDRLGCAPIRYRQKFCQWWDFFFFFYWLFTAHLRVLASSFLTFRDHTQWHNTVGTPLDEWSARRRDLYLTNTQHPQQTNIHASGGIRTRNLSRRAAANPCLRLLGHWDRPVMRLLWFISNNWQML